MVNSAQEAVRSHILKAAAELFAKQGYHATGMKELELASGMGRSSLYYYFANKEELLFEITTRYLRELIDAGHQLLEESISAEDRLRRFSRFVLRNTANNLSELTVCFRELHAVTGANQQTLLDIHRDYENVWARMFAVGVSDGVFATADTITIKAAIGMHHYSYLWLRAEGKQSPESVADRFCNLLIHGVSANSSH